MVKRILMSHCKGLTEEKVEMRRNTIIDYLPWFFNFFETSFQNFLVLISNWNCIGSTSHGVQCVQIERSISLYYDRCKLK